MTPHGQLPFFIDFLKTAGLFDAFVADCPLRYGRPNAPKRRDVLGTAMLAMLAGAKRYAHIVALRGDGVLPELLGMTKVVSEDAIRRAFKAIDEKEGAAWLRAHLAFCVEPLLAEPWILDIDTTINRSTAIRKGRFSATIRRSRDGRAISITPIRWPRRAWFSMSMSVPAMSTRPNTARPACGRSSTVFRAICGRRFCAAIAASAMKASCARRRRADFPISSNRV